MPKIDEETIFDDIRRAKLSLEDHGPLFGPISSFQLYRDEDYSLVLETISDKQSTATFETPPAGTVRYSDGALRFESPTGEAVAFGITPQGHSTKLFESEPGLGRSQSSRIHRVEWTSKADILGTRIIEWLDNCPDAYLWPATVLQWGDKSEEISFVSERYQIGKSFDANPDFPYCSSSRCCIHLNINGVNLYFGKSPEIGEVKNQRGFILYDATPDENFRAKIRDAIAFMVGTYLIYLGETHFDSSWQPVSALAVQSSTLNGSASRATMQPPSLLDLKFKNLINPSILEPAVSRIVEKYDDYEFGAVFWNYWHAVTSPIHMGAINFGAIIERLQEAFYQKNSSISKAIIDKKKWKPLEIAFQKVLEEAQLPDLEMDVFGNKIKNLNVLPQNLMMEKFFQKIDLEIGKIEASAWRNGRNRSAHGGKIKDGGHLDVIRENHIFQTLVNRIILAITGAADQYIDYYSLNHPFRALRLSIPEGPISRS